jgi:hypothetical protein
MSVSSSNESAFEVQLSSSSRKVVVSLVVFFVLEAVGVGVDQVRGLGAGQGTSRGCGSDTEHSGLVFG